MDFFYSEWPTKCTVTLYKVSFWDILYIFDTEWWYNTQKRLVQDVAWSLKYPKVFFPQNCTSFFSFPLSLNILGYPARIEKLPYSHPSSTLPTFLPLSFFVCPSLFLLILRSLAREAIYTRLQTATHYSRTIKLPELCEHVPACMHETEHFLLYLVLRLSLSRRFMPFVS